VRGLFGTANGGDQARRAEVVGVEMENLVRRLDGGQQDVASVQVVAFDRPPSRAVLELA